MRALRALVERTAPELLIASGDLTHRGRPDQHERAARLLRSFAVPVLAVPGNHDIPYSFPARFTRPFAEFERHWQTAEPVYESAHIQAVGLNSVRPWRHQSGGVSDAQLAAWERGHGVKLPQVLRDALKRQDGGVIRYSHVRVLPLEEIEPPDAHGLGRRVRLVTKGWLPYTLRWEFQVVESRYPYGFTMEKDVTVDIRETAYARASGPSKWSVQNRNIDVGSSPA